MKNILTTGNKDSRILIVCDGHPSKVGQIMQDREQNLLIKKLRLANLTPADCRIISPCPQVPFERAKSAKQSAEWINTYRDEFWAKFNEEVKDVEVVVILGKTAAHQVFKKAVAVTKVRGTMLDIPDVPCKCLVTLSPTHVLMRPEVEPDFETDMGTLGKFVRSGYKDTTDDAASGDYKVVTDIQFLLDNPPKVLALDTETTGLDWANHATILCAQISVREGESYIIPFNMTRFPGIDRREMMRGMAQLRRLLAMPEVKVVGHNLKFDLHMLANYRIYVANWWMETMQLAFAMDENMQSKNLDECVRRWVPEMRGYADAFNEETDKSKMLDVPLDKFIKYSGGDTDATFRLCKNLVGLVREDMKQWGTVAKVQMPVLRMFFEMERQGLTINTDRLREFGAELATTETKIYQELLELVPLKVKQKHFSKGLQFSRSEFVIDILFSDDGFGLTPKMFTKGSTEGTMKPSTDNKHLSAWPNNPFIKKFSEYQKIQKMRSTYVGEEGGMLAKEIPLLKRGGFPSKLAALTDQTPDDLKQMTNVAHCRVRMPDNTVARIGLKTEFNAENKAMAYHEDKWYEVKEVPSTGFWKHVMRDGKIHPSFLLHGTVTGRSSSRDPNSQNIPKRGPLAKPYRRMFVATPGYVLLEADESQAELRVAAWQANEPTMLKIYREGGDIHRTTAARASRVKLSEVTAELRQKAKAVAFGFLYGMSSDSFVDYARFQYGVMFTKKEAAKVKEDFFGLYSKLPAWHEKMKRDAHKDGFVRALHGAVRHLPAINSNERGVVAEAERQAINSPIQRMASDISLLGLAMFANGCDKTLMRLLAFIHDAGVVEVREDMMLKGAAWLKWCMENPPLEKLFGIRCPIPLVSDIKVGENLSDMADLNVIAEKPPWVP